MKKKKKHLEHLKLRLTLFVIKPLNAPLLYSFFVSQDAIASRQQIYVNLHSFNYYLLLAIMRPTEIVCKKETKQGLLSLLLTAYSLMLPCISSVRGESILSSC